MVGPSATARRSRSAPHRSMAAIVASRTPVAAPRQLDRHHVGRMNLVGGEQVVRRYAERRGHARAVLGYLGGRVVGACPAVETRIDPVGHAAFTGEEGVADAGEGAQ